MKKKLALMGVLLRKNDILILDEPFNGVDIQSNMVITEIIQELKRLGKTILVSSHIFSTLRESCDEIILLSKGEVLKKVTTDEYAELEREIKQRVVGEQVKKLRLE
ncbi:MAG: ABC transporter ATP-binding protein, partial [Phaeodactylibacter sp.]|nr:ABC transporter ATP-binding protein [Phaeodactylibacter sp.]